jgi:hypothetical protein
MFTRGLYAFTLFVLTSVLAGCSRQAWVAAGQAVAASQQSAPVALLVYGGQGHKTFLGCVNCAETSQSSVLNAYTYGSPYGQTIFNHYSEYGSAYSSESACNPYATDPPVIVDANGTYYGRLTLNEYHSEIGIGRSYVEWSRTKVCNG